MVNRPLAESRPVGPLMDINLNREMGEKVQLGVSGTAMPNIRKSDLNTLYVLDTHVATLLRDVDGTLKNKIQDKFDGTPRVKAKRSGSSSAAPFDEQAVIVELSSDSLPIQDAQLHKTANTIERHYSDFDVGVRTVIMDTE